MGTNRIRRRLDRRQDVSPSLWRWLVDENPEGLNDSGEFSWEIFKLEGEWVHRHRGGPDALRDLWQVVENDVLVWYIAEHPGQRPKRWGWYSAPRVTVNRTEISEPRRQVDGAGQPPWERLPGLSPSIEYGIPTMWWGYEEDDPPCFESTASYLKRHGLFLPDEERELSDEDFEPELVEYKFDYRRP